MRTPRINAAGQFRVFNVAVFQRSEVVVELFLVIGTGRKERHDKRHKRTYKTYGSFDSTPYGVTLRMTLP
ncbi:hypothetical protein [Fibrobacter sp. UWP2]|uniref:hypothetical protein n=1 Tax=Fibrobacter sp. UWP2 TaxID=1896216 RepID=UPI00135640E4|nr:hypothetical protein [Fibrobacter sp. UWP2]